jgi:hypothetical protein
MAGLLHFALPALIRVDDKADGADVDEDFYWYCQARRSTQHAPTVQITASIHHDSDSQTPEGEAMAGLADGDAVRIVSRRARAHALLATFTPHPLGARCSCAAPRVAASGRFGSCGQGSSH